MVSLILKLVSKKFLCSLSFKDASAVFKLIFEWHNCGPHVCAFGELHVHIYAGAISYFKCYNSEHNMERWIVSVAFLISDGTRYANMSKSYWFKCSNWKHPQSARQICAQRGVRPFLSNFWNFNSFNYLFSFNKMSTKERRALWSNT